MCRDGRVVSGVSVSIPISEWVWHGHPAHFINARRCAFRMVTEVGSVVVSTVGEMRRTDGGPVERIGHGRLYETYTFRVESHHECGCPMHNATELSGLGANTARDAHANHMAECHRVAVEQ